MQRGQTRRNGGDYLALFYSRRLACHWLLSPFAIALLLLLQINAADAPLLQLQAAAAGCWMLLHAAAAASQTPTKSPLDMPNGPK